jgi:hypothetical protein
MRPGITSHVYIPCLVLPVLLFPLSVSFHQCSILILLVSEGEAGEAWEPSESRTLSECGALDQNTIPRRFGLHNNIDQLLYSEEFSDQSSGTERLGTEKISSYLHFN